MQETAARNEGSPGNIRDGEIPMSVFDQDAGAVVPDDTGGVAIRVSKTNDNKACGGDDSFRRLRKRRNI